MKTRPSLCPLYDVFLDAKSTLSHFLGGKLWPDSTELNRLDMKIRFQGRALTDALGPLAKYYSIPRVCRPIDAIKTVANSRTKLFPKSEAEEVFLFLLSLSSLSRMERRGADTVPATWSIFWTSRTLYKESVGKSTCFIFFFSHSLPSAQNFLEPCAVIEFLITGELKKELCHELAVPPSCWLIPAEQFTVCCTWQRFQVWAFLQLKVFHCHLFCLSTNE